MSCFQWSAKAQAADCRKVSTIWEVCSCQSQEVHGSEWVPDTPSHGEFLFCFLCAGFSLLSVLLMLLWFGGSVVLVSFFCSLYFLFDKFVVKTLILFCLCCGLVLLNAEKGPRLKGHLTVCVLSENWHTLSFVQFPFYYPCNEQDSNISPYMLESCVHVSVCPDFVQLSPL